MAEVDADPIDPTQEILVGPPEPPLQVPNKAREQVRLILACVVAGAYILFGLIVLAWFIVDKPAIERLTAIVTAVFAPMGTLVGGIVGFYFGASEKGSDG